MAASLLSSAKTQSNTCGREEIFVVKPATDRLGADGVRLLAAVARTGLSKVENSWWWIRNT
jgi:hypothetical protein